MRIVLQRVSQAKVEVDGRVVGSIGRGLMALVGVGRTDDDSLARALAEKVVTLRIFEDEDGKTNLSLLDVGGAVLVVSQFTLYADCRKGRRPSFTGAGDPEMAARLVEVFRNTVEDFGVETASGVFGAHMQVSLVNDGPFTIVLDENDVAVGRASIGLRRDTTAGGE